MAVVPRRSPFWAYLSMAGAAVAVIVGLTLVSEAEPDHDPVTSSSAAVSPEARTPALGTDFMTTVLGVPRASRSAPFCDRRGCCPTRETTFGTTASTEEVIAAFEGQGYVRALGDRAVVRPGPFPQVAWTAELDRGGRWAWRGVEVARGADVGRPDWPTVFVSSSVACGED